MKSVEPFLECERVQACSILRGGQYSVGTSHTPVMSDAGAGGGTWFPTLAF